MHTEAISYDLAGVTYVGYLATPEPRESATAAVLICHEGNGLGPQVKERAHQLADRGYIAFALDYVGGGRVLPDLAAMQAHLGTLRGEPGHVRALARAGLATLVAQPGVHASKVAAIGYCFGGTLALELARDGAELACIVAFHAGLRTTQPGPIKGKVLACIGADDPIVNAEERLAFEAEMRAAKVDWRLEVHGNAVHGFANPNANKLGVPAVQYHELAHKRSWQAMLDLFAETFGPSGRDWPNVIPRIINFETAAHVAFVKSVFGASGDVPDDTPAMVRIGDSIIMISDGGGVRPPTAAMLHVYVSDVDATYARAIAGGAESIEPPAEMPYGDRRAMVQDRWGSVWQIAASSSR